MSRSALLIIVGLLACGAATAQVQRSFVASYGNDTSTSTNCGLNSPCRSFTAAQTVTASGGEIIALDAAGYGPITITKSLSILANPGAYAGISASTGNAVTIATAGVNVRLSGLRINGLGAVDGVAMTNGASLTVDNCTISGFLGNGIRVNAAASVRVLNSLVMNNANDGVQLDGGAIGEVSGSIFLGHGRVGVMAQSGTAVTTVAAVTHSVASANVYGFGVFSPVGGAISRISVSNSSADNNTAAGFRGFLAGGTSATINVASTKVTGNPVGFDNAGGTFNSAGNNMVISNGLNTSGTITTIGTM